MRPFHVFAALVVIGVGIASWATLGQAGPKVPVTQEHESIEPLRRCEPTGEREQSLRMYHFGRRKV